MKANCAAHVRKCHQCQVHGDLKHMLPMSLHTMTSPWLFFTWSIDIIRKIHPTASNGHEFILVAIDYFTKWVEVASYRVLNLKKVTQFIQTNIICRYGYHMKLSQITGCNSREKRRSYFNSSIFNTTNHQPTVLRRMEQLRLQTETQGRF